MSLQSTSTAIGWARDLADKLILRFKSGSGVNSVRQALDANGWPMLFCSVSGNESAGQPVIGLRIIGQLSPANQDIFGNTTIPFAPHTCEIAFEKVVSTGVPFPAFSDLLTAAYEVSKLGVKVADKEIANGTAVTEASMNSTSAKVTLDNIDWPNKGA